MNMHLMMVRARKNHSATAPPSGDPLWADVLSLLHFDGANGSTAFTDEKGIAWTRGGSAVLSAANSKFGGSSLRTVPATGDYIVTPHASLATIGTGDFTIDGWINIISTSGNSLPFSGPAGTNSLLQYYGATLQWNAGGPTIGGNVSLNTWTFFSVCRSAGTMRVHINGALKGTMTSFVDFSPGTSTSSIGYSSATGAHYCDMYLDEFRVTKAARYGASDYAVPTAPFPNLPPQGTDNFASNSMPLYTATGGGAWSIGGGVCSCSTPSLQSILTRNGVSFVNGVVSTTVNTAEDGGLVLRFQDNNNYYLLAFSDNSSYAPNKCTIWKKVGGSFLNPITANTPVWVRGTPQKIEFSINGSQLTAKYNGVVVNSATDSQFSGAGLCGMRCNRIPVQYNSFSWTLQSRPYWRIYNNSAVDQAGGVFSIAELQFRANVGGPSLCVGGTPIASGFYVAGNEPTLAFDGNLSTFWSSRRINSGQYEWIGYTLTAPSVVNEVYIANRADYNAQASRNFTIQSSSDGVTWTDEWTPPPQSSWAAGEVRLFQRI